MKLKKPGGDWFYISFKYENPPAYCFICGYIGHVDSRCARVYDATGGEVDKACSLLTVVARRSRPLVGSQWLRNSKDFSNSTADEGMQGDMVVDNDNDGIMINSGAVTKVLFGNDNDGTVNVDYGIVVTDTKRKILAEESIDGSLPSGPNLSPVKDAMVDTSLVLPVVPGLQAHREL
ncbi:uncharacterized protein LOC126680912 isoform X2 [Mercurialis annua]|uniref:uncharacterized protein LOC126680912 isoform X2 n=1 Tax=Mercurialis annua TaxID=3986 RepID=UPI002160EAD9|nr:uncharacterized protein LOC126680912 isoform X2 [Mercurialis annua]